MDAIQAAEPLSLRVHVHHDAKRLGRGFQEHALENVHHEIHRRVIVVEQNHLEKLGFADIGACALENFVSVLRSGVGHGSSDGEPPTDRV